MIFFQRDCHQIQLQVHFLWLKLHEFCTFSHNHKEYCILIYSTLHFPLFKLAYFLSSGKKNYLGYTIGCDFQGIFQGREKSDETDNSFQIKSAI